MPLIMLLTFDFADISRDDMLPLRRYYYAHCYIHDYCRLRACEVNIVTICAHDAATRRFASMPARWQRRYRQRASER